MKLAASMHRIALLTAGLATILGGPTVALGANPEPLTTTISLAPRAVLTLMPAVLDFPDTSPLAATQVPAAQNPLAIRVKIRKDATVASPATLTVQGGPLVSGSDIIPAANVTWTASGLGFVAGTLSDATPQTAGRWNASGIYTGNLSFYLDNLWSYATGTYSGTATFTLTAP